jgi:hypothetical protein
VTELEPERLSLDDVPEIVGFLDRTWRAAYGTHAFPAFNETYLRWLYGGPRQDDTRLVACRMRGRLLAFRAYLARDIAVRGKRHRALIATHFGVDREVPSARRADVIARLTLLPWQSRSMFPAVDLTYGALEADKALTAKASSIYTSGGLSVAIGQFAHAVANVPDRVETSRTRHVRHATVADAAAIARLHHAVGTRCDLAQCLTADDIAHHWFTAPEGEVYVTEDADGINGALCAYRLETVTAGGTGTVAICEGFLASDVAAATALLDAGVNYRRRIGAKGLVCENVTYLPVDFRRACGLLPSLRQMKLCVASRQPVDLGESWLIDIK